MNGNRSTEKGAKAPFIVYKITCWKTGKLYIGVTCQKLNRRRAHHISSAKRLYRKGWLQIAIAEIGEQYFTISEIERCESKSEMLKREKYWIGELNTGWPNGYNKVFYSTVNNGWKHTDEARRKIAESKTGKHPTEETRKKLSAWQKGGKLSDEHKRKMSEAKTGKTLSDYHRERIRQSKIGRKHSEAHRQAIIAGRARRKQRIE